MIVPSTAKQTPTITRCRKRAGLKAPASILAAPSLNILTLPYIGHKFLASRRGCDVCVCLKESSAMSRARVHLGYLDGLRGWASLYVVGHHVWQFVVSRPDADRLPRWFTLFTLFKPGSFGVTVFIVLSGYCLALPVARASEPELAGGFSNFVRRRARRILPPYYAALAFALSLVLAYPELQTRTYTEWDLALPPLTFASITSHVFLVHNLVQALQWSLNPPLWSVALEWQIYFVFALLLVPLWRRRGLAPAVLVALVLGVVPLVFGGNFAHPWFLGSFGLGMGAAALGFAARYRALGLVERWPWGRIAIALSILPLAALMLNRRWPLPDVLAELGLSGAVAAMLVRSTRAVEENRHSRLLRALEHPWSARLGAFSYSLYLVHYPMLAVMALPLRRLEQPLMAFACLMLLGVPVMLTLSFAFHWVFERPFLSTEVRRAAAPAHETRT
jgi:peptidoglycan/LPS O-acetylase OafA/YrhL